MITLDSITLPSDLLWENEFDSKPIEQSSERGLDGTLLLQHGTLINGRSIVLTGAGDSWVTRSVVEAIEAKKQTNPLMTLSYHGTDYSVMFDYANTPLEATQLFRIENPGAHQDRYYQITIRLITV